MVACFGKGHYHPLLRSDAHDGTMPHLTLSWYSNESWHCACDSSFVHKALCPCVWHPASCLELTSLLLYPHATSKQQTMTLCSWLFKRPCIRHCGLVALCHCWEGSPHTSCHYGYGLHTTTFRGAYVWVLTRLVSCTLLVSKVLHRCPLVWPHPCHHASP